ncbi:hypothetical protein SVAN01_09672 [Stagonosporopsis vannaccii]|nr:hypothetical protein SVAN01_09672 [Stagonosporopsis vannaccii]
MLQLLFLPLLISQVLSAAAPKPFGEQKYVNNAGVKIHYRKYANRNPAAPWLLFQHGFPDRETTWNDYQIPAFSRHYNILTPTLRGFPPSDVPPNAANYTADALASDMLAILDKEKVKKIVLIGHDFGGGLGQGFTLANPDRVSAFIILNAAIFPIFGPLLASDPEAQEYARYTIPYYSYVPGQPKNISTMVQNIRDPEYRAEIASYLDRSPIDGMMNLYRSNYPGPPYGGNLSAIFTRETWTQQIPVMLVWGEEEEYFSPKSLNGVQGWFKYGLRLVTVPKAGHWAFRDQWKRVNEEIRSFLAVAGTIERDVI